jgi:7-carboxy-7-deazaguanine synthase
MKINEIFLSIQGEGVHTGYPTTFVRTSGCNMECDWCDTAYARDEESGKRMSISVIMARIKANGVYHVCLTGGGPLLQEDSLELVTRLAKEGYTVSIETNGSLPIDDYIALEEPKVTISMDIKCPSSGMTEYNRIENLAKLRPVDELKFVIKNDKDLEFAKRILKAHKVKCQIIFQPVEGIDPRWLTEMVLQSGLKALGVRVMLQVHKVIWGDKRGV